MIREKRDRNVPMTEGSIPRGILLFSLPLIFSNVLQVLFNISDIAVVGKFAGAYALGAVGCTANLVALFTGLLMGIGSGVNVIVARRLGEKNLEGVRRTVHTSFLICVFAGVLIALLSILTARPILALMGTKAELIDGAALYLKVYFLGMPALGIYNYGNATLSAKGDTKSPLLYLSIAGAVNVVLNLFFVLVLQMTVDGVALASVISQYLSAVLILRRLLFEKSEIRLEIKEIRLYRKESAEVISLGVPAGIQNAIFQVANVFIQGGVNTFEPLVVSGAAAAANADGIIYDVMAAFYAACSAFIGQNVGAGKKDRVRKSYRVSVLYSFGSAAVLGILLVLFGRPFLSVFTSDPTVVEAGMSRISVMGFSYCISAFMDCTIAASRGLGKSFYPTLFVVLGSCVFRVFWVFCIFPILGTIPALFALYSCSWSMTAVAEILYFISVFKKIPESATPLEKA